MINYIDLFAGAGGLSEGFIKAGFKPISHIEMNQHAANTLITRAAYEYLKENAKLSLYSEYISGQIDRTQFLSLIPDEVINTVMCETISHETVTKIFQNIDLHIKEKEIEGIDVIVGGPPCQAYSLVGRAQSSHMNHPMSEDPRNYLYKLYVLFLKKYQPKMFVFENVMGIASANGGQTWKDVQEYLKNAGYEIECHQQNSKDYGVLQNRKRMIIVGWKKGSNLQYPILEKISTNAVVNDLLIDLPSLLPGECKNQYKTDIIPEYLKEFEIRTETDILTHHVCRTTNKQDIEIYRKTIELWNDGHKRLNYSDLPGKLKTHKNQKSFLDRFKVVEGDCGHCHTMLAHISKDGHYFIHPDIEQHRSISVREAARIQSFPDNYYFEGPRTAQFVQIGNAVPPLMARAIAKGILDQLNKEE